MSLLSQALAGGFSALHAILGDSFTIAGVPLYGTFTAEQTDADFSDYSLREKVIRTCVALKAQFASRPNPDLRDTIVYSGIKYEVYGIHEDQLHYTLLLRRSSPDAADPSAGSAGLTWDQITVPWDEITETWNQLS